MQADSIVLGAGIVGVSTAIHLAKRGRSVVLVDRRRPGEETSFGNAGLIQREGVLPHAFPQNFLKLLKYGLNNSIDMSYHLSALPGIAPFLARYWWASRAENYARITKLYEPLIAQSLAEHDVLIKEAGAESLIAKNGWYMVFRNNETRDEAYAEADFTAREFGVNHAKLTKTEMHGVEPYLAANLSGALHWTDPWSIRDPHQLVLAYLALFEKLGGTFLQGDATTLAAKASGKGWQVSVENGVVEAGEAVIAMGPWSDLVTRRLGYRLPLGVKRGYHMHYGAADGATLGNWIYDAESGYLLTPMSKGIRLTTGAEFARRDAPKTPVQLERAEREARRLFPLGERLEAEPWMGARPCTPDMMPIIGPAPRHDGLWFAFGHAHHGMTLGPVTGRIIAEQMAGETPFVHAEPFSARRFIS